MYNFDSKWFHKVAPWHLGISMLQWQLGIKPCCQILGTFRRCGEVARCSGKPAPISAYGDLAGPMKSHWRWGTFTPAIWGWIQRYQASDLYSSQHLRIVSWSADSLRPLQRIGSGNGFALGGGGDHGERTLTFATRRFVSASGIRLALPNWRFTEWGCSFRHTGDCGGHQHLLSAKNSFQSLEGEATEYGKVFGLRQQAEDSSLHSDS